jgi:hypothetical protein
MSLRPGEWRPPGAAVAELAPMTPGEPRPITPERHPAALAVAITRTWRPYRWRAYLVGAVVGILVGGIPTAIATTSVTVALAVAGVTVDPGLPWAEMIWSAAFVVAFAASGAWAVASWLPRDFKAATETYLWLATCAETHWRDRFGDVEVPRTPARMRASLDATPATPETAGDRFGLWMGLGNLEAARGEIAQMPETTAVDRHSRAAAGWLVDFAGGTTGPLEPLGVSAAAIDDAGQRLEAEVGVAVSAARVALAEGGDWRAPLAGVRGRLGREPARIMWRFAWGSAFRGMLAAAAIGVGAYWAFLLVL